MNRIFSFGLIGRIVIALALVFAVLILLNDLTVTSVIKMSLSNAEISTNAPETLSTDRYGFITSLRKPILIYSVTAALLSLIIASFAIHRIVVRPIRRITHALDDVAHGKANVRVDIDGAMELILMGRNFNQMFETIQQQKQDLETQLAQLEHTADELKNTQDDLIRAAKLASVGTLASGIAHEIGNPIAGIMGLMEALENEKDAHAATSYRLLIRREIERIDKIIRDLLSYARPTVSKQPGQSLLPDVLQHVTRLMTPQKNFSHIKLDFTQIERVPPLGIGSDDLTAVFINLFLNAAQAISGKGTISVYCETEDDAFHTMNTVAIHVVDNGPGIPPEIAAQIFEPFFTNRKAGGGTGLGLAICQSICERNQSRIELFRAADPGAHFRILIPTAGETDSDYV